MISVLWELPRVSWLYLDDAFHEHCLIVYRSSEGLSLDKILYGFGIFYAQGQKIFPEAASLGTVFYVGSISCLSWQRARSLVHHFGKVLKAAKCAALFSAHVALWWLSRRLIETLYLMNTFGRSVNKSSM